jgi:hypothetical protein
MSIYAYIATGDPDNVELQGLSAGENSERHLCFSSNATGDIGSHSVHQQLHRVSCLPEGQYAPFQSAILQSNAILYDYSRFSVVSSLNRTLGRILKHLRNCGLNFAHCARH